MGKAFSRSSVTFDSIPEDSQLVCLLATAELLVPSKRWKRRDS